MRAPAPAALPCTGAGTGVDARARVCARPQSGTPPPEEDEGGGKKKAKKAATAPWPLIPAKKEREEPENESLFFTLCKKKLGEEGTVLVLRKCPMRCHFQVVEIQGVAQPKGEAVAVGAEARKKLLERWQAQLKKHPKEPKPTLPAEDAEGGPLVNFLAGACVAVRLDRLEAVKKRKEVTGRAANKRFEEHELITSLKLCSNKDDLAAKFAVKMQGLENQVYDEKPGHATRGQVKYALQTCEFSKEGAVSMLFSPQGEKLLKPKTEYILERLGLDTGLGYPSTQLIERLLVKSNYDEVRRQPATHACPRLPARLACPRWRLPPAPAARRPRAERLPSPSALRPPPSALRPPPSALAEPFRGHVRPAGRCDGRPEEALQARHRDAGRDCGGGGGGGDADARTVRPLRLRQAGDGGGRAARGGPLHG